MDLKEKKKNLETLLSQKISQLQNTENIRNQLTNEVLELKGKVEMLNELISETKE
jgi:hypothetical protein